MRVTVGVSGGIAAYKAVEVVRALQRQALEVHVVMTEAACKFVQPLTFFTLTGHRVVTSLWDDPADGSGETTDQNGIEHTGEAQWADALVVAPATANILAKFAHGIADDYLTTLYLATTAPVLVAPAMNTNMWEHPATQANLETLRQRGVRVIEPGAQAEDKANEGCMAGPGDIADVVLGALGRRHDLAGEVVLVTAGGTREALDSVRFLGNRSSGKMGYALAEAAQSRGAKVILISGPSALHSPAHCELVKVVTADEMRQAVLARMTEATLVINAAAVADYRPVNVSGQKLKRTGPVTLELAPTEDILAEVARRRRPGQLIVGFAAETDSQMAKSRAKLLAKGVDAIVVNTVNGEADSNAANFLTHTTSIELHAMPKRQLADRILDEILTLRRPQSLVVEFDENEDEKTRQDRVLKEAAAAARQLIVE
jgi:phosphopantothenoylcysteine decarboxylase/phosphopantothenate--cysteine ligase